MAKDVYRIPVYLAANTKDELVKKMLANNLRDDKEYDYFDIQKEGSNWIAWYYKQIREAANGKQSGKTE